MLYTRSSRLPQARLGIVAAKRFAPRAVTRNMIKRLCREAFRHSGMSAVDCIVRLSAPVTDRTHPASTARLKAQLRQELQQLFPPKVFAEKSL